MLSLREPQLGIPQYVGVLSDKLIVLSGIAVRRRWSSSGEFELSPTRRKEKLKVKRGDSVFLWGPTIDETEEVAVMSRRGGRLTVERKRPRCRDGAVQVVTGKDLP